MVQPLWKTVQQFLKRLNRLPCDTAIPFISIFQKEMKKICHTETWTWMFIAALLIAKKWKQPKGPSTDEWIYKTWYVHTNEYYSAIKRNEVLIHATKQMYFKNIMLNERRQSQRTPYSVIPLTWNIQNRQIYTNREYSHGTRAGNMRKGKLVQGDG